MATSWLWRTHSARTKIKYLLVMGLAYWSWDINHDIQVFDSKHVKDTHCLVFTNSYLH
jgi:hypothetical protein